jgi:hypothetical protein
MSTLSSFCSLRNKTISNLKGYYTYTFGISTDPLTKFFAIVFSALIIHDLDHYGWVQYAILFMSNHPIAVTYDGRSPMEQLLFFQSCLLSYFRAALYDTQERILTGFASFASTVSLPRMYLTRVSRLLEKTDGTRIFQVNRHL